MIAVIPNYIEVKLHYETDYELCFLCGALCLSDYSQYRIYSDEKYISVEVYLDELESFNNFVKELKVQTETHYDLFVDDVV